MGFFKKMFGGGSATQDEGQTLQTKEAAEKRLEGMKLHAKEEINMAGLGNQKARVGLVVDISASMDGFFRAGTVQRIAERALGLGLNFDDDGQIDVFAFGTGAHTYGEISQGDFYNFQRDLQKRHRLEYGTRYGKIIETVCQYYSKPGDPAYVMFVTDGDNQDKAEATQAIVEASRLPIFWQFIGIGSAGFSYLEHLDNMDGRFIDNANFFQVNDIDSIDDNELYRRMLGEFPQWLNEARTKSIF